MWALMPSGLILWTKLASNSYGLESLDCFALAMILKVLTYSNILVYMVFSKP